MATHRPAKVMVVEDKPLDFEFAQKALGQGGEFELIWSQRLSEAIRLLTTQRMDAVLLDVLLGEGKGLENLEALHAHAPDVPIVAWGVPDDEALAIEAVHRGAQDYVVKGRLAEKFLSRAIRSAMARNVLLIELRQRANELIESEHTLRQIVQANLDGMILVDPAGIVRYANPAAEALFGRQRNDLVGAPAGLPVLGQGEFELEVRRPDASTSLVEMHVAEVTWQGKKGWVASFRDVTHRARVMHVLRDKLDDLEQLAHVASHDLQEPLRMIISYLTLLDNRYQDKLNIEAQEFIGFAVDGALWMQNLVNDLLSYLRASKSVEPMARVDCEHLFSEVTAGLRMAIAESQAVVTHDPLPTITGSATQLAHVFHNLLQNAVKFRGDKPPQIHVHAERRENEWLFSVRDNGIGIDPKYSQQVFVIFQRLHTRDLYPGTGIGLSIAKRVIEQHRGRIWVDSQPEQGSVFYFTIPIRPEVEPATGKSAQPLFSVQSEGSPGP